jgi:hypothetical protein
MEADNETRDTSMNELHNIKTEESYSNNLNNFEESFEQIELKIEKEDIMKRDDFYSNPITKTKKLKTPIKNLNISYSYKRLGNTFSFWYNKEGQPLFIIGPHCKNIF